VGTPSSTGLQVSVRDEVEARVSSLTSYATSDRAYLNYALPNSDRREIGEKDQKVSFQKPPAQNTRDVSLRSKPISISTRKTPAGNVTYRVTGTPNPGGRQRKFDTTNYEAAEAQRQIWEAQRLRGDSASRPKLTYLTLLQIREAEAIVEMLKTEGLSPMDAVKLGLEAHRAAKSAAPATIVEVPDYETGFASFLEDTKAHVSDAQYTAYRQRGGRFGKFVGNKKLITAITEQSMKSWLASAKARNGGPIEKKTWNNLYGDVAAVFNFFVRKGWLTKSPFSGMKRYSKKALRRGPKKRLTIEQCQNLMAYLEDHHPDWCCYFAIALFAGIRPDTTNGEMWELARCVERDGIDTYYSNKVFHLTGEIALSGNPEPASCAQRDVEVLASGSDGIFKKTASPPRLPFYDSGDEVGLLG